MTERSDAELIATARDGSAPAFAELYDRHVEAARGLARRLARSPADADDLVAGAFTRVLEALRGGRGPTEAFRAYLLTALRHLAYDRYRAEARVALTDDMADVVGVDPERTIVPFSDPALAGLERTLAARAFATLPERWQAVLWHLEVEGDSAADIAPLFGLTPNAVSALAYRARERLRQAYLQEHLSAGVGRRDRRHRETQERLGAWTRGGLAPRDAARVEAHLAECDECAGLAAELREVNAGMVRAVIAPLVLGAGLAGYLASRGSPEHLAGAWTGATDALATWPAPGGRAGLAGAGLLAAAGLTAALGLGGPAARAPTPPDHDQAGAVVTETPPGRPGRPPAREPTVDLPSPAPILDVLFDPLPRRDLSGR